ncbi:unnamed protein product, partial [Adineta steineri]
PAELNGRSTAAAEAEI